MSFNVEQSWHWFEVLLKSGETRVEDCLDLKELLGFVESFSRLTLIYKLPLRIVIELDLDDEFGEIYGAEIRIPPRRAQGSTEEIQL